MVATENGRGSSKDPDRDIFRNLGSPEILVGVLGHLLVPSLVAIRGRELLKINAEF